MPTPDDPFAPLRDALAVSPTNVPLRIHLADSLLGANRPDDAEAALKDGLARSPHDYRLKLGLARVYLKQGQYSAGLVLCEDVTGPANAPSRGFVLLSRLLLPTGEPVKAVEAYRKGISLDPSVSDEELAEQLGAGREGPGDEESVAEGELGGRVPVGPVSMPDDPAE